ncbi:hypothetical protein SAY87_020870 [Trapa incisa]|uniref:Uncharacterized protein n=1 Tax=Trapa incisa TaxID=236973 RepID=A0AAN7PNH2_9MYRT|nr:hypothetical protein SAY87_020870 [Trapa incisa]
MGLHRYRNSSQPLRSQRRIEPLTADTITTLMLRCCKYKSNGIMGDGGPPSKSQFFTAHLESGETRTSNDWQNDQPKFYLPTFMSI